MYKGITVIQSLIDEFSKLPGIGPKSSARIVYYLLNMPASYNENFATELIALKRDTKICKTCFNITSEEDICEICSNDRRDKSVICVVEEPLDILSIERGSIFSGVYHVLGGVISPIKGVGPEDIRINQLITRIKNLSGEKTEVILAMNPNLEGEATAMYIYEKLKTFPNIKVTRIARGLPTGADIEYADNMTLKKALENRTNY